MAGNIVLKPTIPINEVDAMVLGDNDLDFGINAGWDVVTKRDISRLGDDIKKLFDAFHGLNLNLRMGDLDKRMDKIENKIIQYEVAMVQNDQRMEEASTSWKLAAAKLERGQTAAQAYMQKLFEENVNLSTDVARLRASLEAGDSAHSDDGNVKWA